ncbi:hypothetical protein [Stakelama tenebrarum]|uniref:Uncharacterized protein n=1 Tax=Stakelama tenebrarum TaxID=2711215 RepID=A0A6G6Y1W4_9SPHN|nr:hypothetical protein [Sphingosinithalassobacter tenebrarum]QIG78915.1 hypothetical protein G5C33_03345 [Sphingosinithalassobacter tenebrarum]
MYGNRQTANIIEAAQAPLPTPLHWLRRSFGLTVVLGLALLLVPVLLVLNVIWIAKAARLVFPMARDSIIAAADSIADTAFPRA